MTERINSIYRLVTVPAFYSLFQNMLGAQSARRRLVRDYYDVHPRMRLLDLGCGPGDLFEFLPDVDYTGIDLNPKHIAAARRRHGTGGTFINDDVANLTVEPDSRFDRIIFSGLLHHLDDVTAKNLVQACGRLLASGGRLIGHEPCYVDGQHPFARWMKDRDSGQDIREAEGYRSLFSEAGGTLETLLLDDLIRIPYNHIVISWSK